MGQVEQTVNNPTPNVENLNKLIEVIYAENLAKFSMSHWIWDTEDAEGCGTVACIGGTAQLLIHHDSKDRFSVSERAIADWMGISYVMSQNLFFGINDHAPMVTFTAITKEAAIEALKDIRDGKGFDSWNDYV